MCQRVVSPWPAHPSPPTSLCTGGTAAVCLPPRRCWQGWRCCDTGWPTAGAVRVGARQGVLSEAVGGPSEGPADRMDACCVYPLPLGVLLLGTSAFVTSTLYISLCRVLCCRVGLHSRGGRQGGGTCGAGGWAGSADALVSQQREDDIQAPQKSTMQCRRSSPSLPVPPPCGAGRAVPRARQGRPQPEGEQGGGRCPHARCLLPGAHGTAGVWGSDKQGWGWRDTHEGRLGM